MTLIIAVFLIIGGIFCLEFALSERFTGWQWVLLNGGVSLLLGLMILQAVARLGAVGDRPVVAHRSDF